MTVADVGAATVPARTGGHTRVLVAFFAVVSMTMVVARLRPASVGAAGSNVLWAGPLASAAAPACGCALRMACCAIGRLSWQRSRRPHARPALRGLAGQRCRAVPAPLIGPSTASELGKGA
jgi:hypothetical protein